MSHPITFKKKHRCGSHKPAGWWWSNIQHRDGRTDALIQRADEGEQTGHISSLGYPMTLHTNYGASWTCTPLVCILNLHTKDLCPRSHAPEGFGWTDWWTDGWTRVVMKDIFLILGIPWTCTPKIIALCKLNQGQKLLRILIGFTWVTDRRTKVVMQVIFLFVGIPWICTPKIIVLSKLNHGQKCLRILLGFTWVTDGRTKVVM